MIQMPQVDISQLVNREAQGPSSISGEPSGRQGDFMAIIQQRIQAESGEQARTREPERARAEERPEPATGNDDARQASRAQESQAAENAAARPAEQAEGERPRLNKTGEEERADDIPVGRSKDGTEDDRRDRVKGRSDKTGSKERAGEAGESAAAGPAIKEAVLVSAQSALQSLKGLGDSAPEIKNLEKSLQALQEMAINGADRSRRPEMMLELRARMKDALLQLERQEASGSGARGEKIADAKNRIRSLGGIMDQQVQDGRNGRQKAQAGTSGNEARAPQAAQDFQLAAAPRETGRQGERTADSGDNRDGGINIGNGRNFQSQVRNAAQAAAPRSPIFNEQFESLMNSARIVVRDGKNGSFIMNLYPETMGRVNVNLGLDDGVIVGRFLVDSREAQELMMENIDSLRLKLEEAGIQVGSFQVNVRGERERLVRQLQEGTANPAGREPVEAQRDYEIQSYRRHDGALDVIA